MDSYYGYGLSDWMLGIRDIGNPPKCYGMSRQAKRHKKARLIAKLAK